MNENDIPAGIDTIDDLPLTDEAKRLLDALHDAMGSLANVDARIALAELERNQRQADVTVTALEARTPYGELVAGNDIARKAYIEQAVRNDDTCKRLAVLLLELQYERARALADVEVLRAAVRLMAAQTPTV